MKEIVILGAGFAGLKALHFLQKSSLDFHITLIDKNDYHCEKISLAEVAAGSLCRDDICYQIEDIIKPKKTTFVRGTVTEIDAKNQMIHLEDQDIHYDYAIVGLGFVPETFGIQGADRYALHMTTVEEAEAIYQHLLSEFKAYQNDNDPRHLNIIVCGAGFTGIELLGDLLDQRDEEYSRKFNIPVDQFNIYCINADDHYLPMFQPKLAEYGIQKLKKRGAKFVIGRVSKLEENQVFYHDENENEQHIEANTIIWTTGVSGSPVMQQSHFPEHRNRVRTNADLSYGQYPNLYITGDVAAFFPQNEDRPYPTTAQIALQMGETSAKNILHQLKNEKTDEFKYHNLGTVASLGNKDAFGTSFGMNFKGYIASVMKKMIDDLSLIETGGCKELLACGKFDFYH